MEVFTIRLAQTSDAAAIARIYNQGIEERIATFETEPRTAQDIERRLLEPHPLVVAKSAGAVVGWG